MEKRLTLGEILEAIPSQRQIMLAQGTPEELEECFAAAKDTLNKLDQLNSLYPDTKVFLESRGVTLVSQLDAAGREELTKHLMRTLSDLLKK